MRLVSADGGVRAYRPLAVVAALLTAGAGAIHAGTIGTESEASTLFGTVFVAMAVAQIGWAFAFALWPMRAFALLGIAVNGGILIMWLVSRTAGVPVGPLSGERLPVAFPDAMATTLEGVALTVTAFLLWAGLRRARIRTSGAIALVAGTVTAVAVAAALAVLVQEGTLTFLPAST